MTWSAWVALTHFMAESIVETDVNEEIAEPMDGCGGISASESAIGRIV